MATGLSGSTEAELLELLRELARREHEQRAGLAIIQGAKYRAATEALELGATHTAVAGALGISRASLGRFLERRSA